MPKKKEELEVESLEEQVKELRRSLFGLFESLIPPKEVREEVVKNLYTIELSALKILKALIDYKVDQLEDKTRGKKSSGKAKKIKVE